MTLCEIRSMPANNMYAAVHARAGAALNEALPYLPYAHGMDESSAAQNRRSRRSPVLLAASVEVDGAVMQVKLRNLSSEGALIEGDRLPKEGETTFFVRKDLRVKSKVAWVAGRFAGVAFARPLGRDELLRQVPTPRPRVQPEFRRPGLACRPLSTEERQMVERWMNTPNRLGE
jgi:hypothetical protein